LTDIIDRRYRTMAPLILYKIKRSWNKIRKLKKNSVGETFSIAVEIICCSKIEIYYFRKAFCKTC
jgi:hypothetical protein